MINNSLLLFSLDIICNFWIPYLITFFFVRKLKLTTIYLSVRTAFAAFVFYSQWPKSQYQQNKANKSNATCFHSCGKLLIK